MWGSFSDDPKVGSIEERNVVLGQNNHFGKLIHLFDNRFAESGLSNNNGGSSTASSGMDMLTGSAVMSLTIIWPSVITFGSYDLADDDDVVTEQEPSFLTKLTGTLSSHTINLCSINHWSSFFVVSYVFLFCYF